MVKIQVCSDLKNPFYMLRQNKNTIGLLRFSLENAWSKAAFQLP